MGLWDEMSSAEWVANTGIPLFLTIAAILAGFWTLRRQMEHDRILVPAQRRAQAAQKLGAAIQKEMELFGEGLGNDSRAWTNKRYEGKRELHRALGEAGGVLGELPAWHDKQWTQVTIAADILDHAWQYAVARRRSAARRWGLNTIQLNDAMSLFLYPYSQHLERIAESFLRWDGIIQLPVEPEWKADPPVTGIVFWSRYKPKGFWAAEHAHEYKMGEAQHLDPEWYAELEASWESCLEAIRDIYGGAEDDEADELESAPVRRA